MGLTKDILIVVTKPVRYIWRERRGPIGALVFFILASIAIWGYVIYTKING